MAQVILLCGKIASGKTTYAQQLRREGRAVILSYDELMLLLFDGCLGARHDETVARICQYFYRLAEQLLAADDDVIMDFGYWRQAERQCARDYFAARGIVTRLVYFAPPEGERIRRLEARNHALASATERVFVIDEILRQSLDRKFEPPSAAETDLMIND